MKFEDETTIHYAVMTFYADRLRGTVTPTFDLLNLNAGRSTKRMVQSKRKLWLPISVL